MADTLRPVAPEERVHALDLLRGWAMFGVLWSNLNDHYGPTDPVTGLDRALSFAQEWFVEGRFYSLLIILFGIGFGFQLTRAEARGTDIRTIYWRRSLALLLIGVVHGTLIWQGDILTIYALVAFALLLFRTASTRNILLAAILLWFLGPTLVREAMFLAGLRIPVAIPKWESVFAHGTWDAVERARMDGYLQWLGRWGLWTFPQILASYLIGLWAIRTGWFLRLIEDRRMTWRLLGISFVMTLAGLAAWNWWDTLWPRAHAPAGSPPAFLYVNKYFQLEQLRITARRLFDWAQVCCALFYSACLLLAWQRPVGQRLLRPLAATGRMALTTYLTQSVSCTLLFYGYGLGWYAHVGFTGMFAVTLVLFSIQMLVSTWWLKRWRYGPAEWLWRTLTYGKAPPMRAST